MTTAAPGARKTCLRRCWRTSAWVTLSARRSQSHRWTWTSVTTRSEPLAWTGSHCEPQSALPLLGRPHQPPIGACATSDGPPARLGPPRAAHAVGYRPRGVKRSFAGSSARSSGSPLSRWSRPRPLRPRRLCRAARRDGPTQSTPTTPSLLPSKAYNRRWPSPGDGQASRRSPTVPSASSMVWRCSRTARGSTRRPFAWPTRNCASRAPTTLRSRRLRPNTLTCWAGPVRHAAGPRHGA